jgi:hypothetical protein
LSHSAGLISLTVGAERYKYHSSNRQMIRMVEKATVDRIHFDFKFFRKKKNRFFATAPSTKIIHHLLVCQYMNMYISLVYKRFHIHSFSLSNPPGQSTFATDSTIPLHHGSVHIIQHIIDSLIYLAFVFPPPSFFSSS